MLNGKILGLMIRSCAVMRDSGEGNLVASSTRDDRPDHRCSHIPAALL